MDAENLCGCGCGETTPIAKYDRPDRGYRAGEHKRFVAGHQNRRPPTWIDGMYEEVPGPLGTPCWEWSGSRHPLGYASAIIRAGVKKSPYRLMYERHNGAVPDGLELDHLCRNPPCINPEHLEPVTHAVNMQRGSNAKLDLATARVIRRRVAGGDERSSLAARYGVTVGTIHHIVNGRTWREPVTA